MIRIDVDGLTFSFPDGCAVGKYDEWTFYRQQGFQNTAGSSKAVDILCIADDEAWLIEVKDYSSHPRTKKGDIADEVATKVRDTLAGLAVACKRSEDCSERRLAQQALGTRKWRAVLHLEQPPDRTPLRQQTIDPSRQIIKLRSLLKAIDPDAMVLNRSNSGGVPWTVY